MNETKPRNRIIPLAIIAVVLYIVLAIMFMRGDISVTQLPPPTNSTLPPLFANHYYDECLSQQLSDNCTVWRIPTWLELRWYLGL